VFEMYMGSGIFWLLYMLVVVVCLLPAFIMKTIMTSHSPRDAQVAREIEKNLKKRRAVEFSSVASVTKLVDNRIKPLEIDDDVA
jgi:F0F1-type ATP synthase membrane subunit b/b'